MCIRNNYIREKGYHQFTARNESEVKWEAFLLDLYSKGLEGKNCMLSTTDGCPGLQKALDTVCPYIAGQRFWAYDLRNVANKLRVKYREDCLSVARLVYPAEHRNGAVKDFRE